VYRIDPNSSKVVELTHEVSKPNGLAISPDQKTLYVAETDNGTDKIDSTKPAPPQGVMRIYAFPLDLQGNVAGPRRTVVDFGAETGCDGMTVDSHGHIYLTVRSSRRPGVMVIEPAGREVAFIPTGPGNQAAADPVGLPSNVEFGLKDEAHMLYVTVDKSLYRIGLKVKGFHHQYD
jgi:gluconolactonase